MKTRKIRGKCSVYKIGDKMMADDPKMSLFKSVVAQFIGSPFVTARPGKPADAIPQSRRLPRPALSAMSAGHAMTESEEPES
jgi:hypothetical protein